MISVPSVWPESRDTKIVKGLINTDDSQPFDFRLSSQHSIKWVMVDNIEEPRVACVANGIWQSSHRQFRYVQVGSFCNVHNTSELTQTRLCYDFPNLRSTNKDIMSQVTYQFDCCPGHAACIAYNEPD